jgi:hypothetical protein
MIVRGTLVLSAIKLVADHGNAEVRVRRKLLLEIQV